MLPLTRIGDDWAAAGGDSLQGRVILVTGATGGLGRATALAAAASGATVVLLGRRLRALEGVYDEIEKSAAPKPALYPLDLAGAAPKDYVDLAAAVERECGRLDGVVHAAAHFDTLQPFEQQAPEEWLRGMQVNLTAPFQLTQACMPALRRSQRGAIVFVLDDIDRVGKAFWGGYGVAKHALSGLASIVHEETENSAVRTHAVLPPPMRTALRRAAYYGEDTLARPDPAATAAAVVALLGDAGGGLRGRTLDLREAAASG